MLLSYSFSARRGSNQAAQALMARSIAQACGSLSKLGAHKQYILQDLLRSIQMASVADLVLDLPAANNLTAVQQLFALPMLPDVPVGQPGFLYACAVAKRIAPVIACDPALAQSHLRIGLLFDVLAEFVRAIEIDILPRCIHLVNELYAHRQPAGFANPIEQALVEDVYRMFYSPFGGDAPIRLFETSGTLVLPTLGYEEERFKLNRTNQRVSFLSALVRCAISACLAPVERDHGLTQVQLGEIERQAPFQLAPPAARRKVVPKATGSDLWLDDVLVLLGLCDAARRTFGHTLVFMTSAGRDMVRQPRQVPGFLREKSKTRPATVRDDWLDVFRHLHREPSLVLVIHDSMTRFCRDINSWLVETSGIPAAFAIPALADAPAGRSAAVPGRTSKNCAPTAVRTTLSPRGAKRDRPTRLGASALWPTAPVPEWEARPSKRARTDVNRSHRRPTAWKDPLPPPNKVEVLRNRTWASRLGTGYLVGLGFADCSNRYSSMPSLWSRFLLAQSAPLMS